MENIGEYQLDKPLTSENAGFCKWGFAIRNGKEYFIKEFLKPVFPLNAIKISEEIRERKRNICYQYEAEQKKLYSAINEAADGNLLRVKEFFRYGSKYYITTEKLSAMPLENIVKKAKNIKKTILLALAHSLAKLHAGGIVHSDIKMDNIIFYKLSNDFYSAKIIDIGACFWEKQPPDDPEKITVDLFYMAPETCAFLNTGEGRLNSKIDVFAMGIIFHQILSGELPKFDQSEFAYPCDCVMSGRGLILDGAITGDLYIVISKMLEGDPEKRWSMRQVFEFLSGKKVCSTKAMQQEKTHGWFKMAGEL